MTFEDNATTSWSRACEACAEPAPADASWCEACGHELGVAEAASCVACGEKKVDELGYCLSCGHRQPRPEDHVEVDLGVVGAASDRGRRHRSNEDAVAVAHLPASEDGGQAADETGTIILVVCDGVSATARAAEASQAAAVAACDYLVEALGAGPEVIVESALSGAVAAAQRAATECVDPAAEVDPSGAPSTTLVASVIRGATVTTAWVGDSRSYWIGDDPRKLNGVEHEIGGSLVKWLGADSMDPVPDIAATEIEGSGSVVVCSDGLWRYASEANDLAEVIRTLGEQLDQGQSGNAPTATVDMARALVDYANEAGGHDNISVAIYAVGLPLGGGQVTPEPTSETGESKA